MAPVPAHALPAHATVERLRLAAALTHRVGPVALTLWPRTGPQVVISADVANHPDLSACEFRNLVLDAHNGVGCAPGGAAPAGALSWLFDLEDLTVEGVGVRPVGDGVIGVERDEARWWWATTLDAHRLPLVLGDAAADLVERGEAPPEVIAAADVEVSVDIELGVSVASVGLPANTARGVRLGDEVARGLSRACLVEELLDAALGGHQGGHDGGPGLADGVLGQVPLPRRRGRSGPL